MKLLNQYESLSEFPKNVQLEMIGVFGFYILIESYIIYCFINCLHRTFNVKKHVYLKSVNVYQTIMVDMIPKYDLITLFKSKNVSGSFKVIGYIISVTGCNCTVLSF